MLAKKMGSAVDRCLFSHANLLIATLMNYFGRAVFYLRKHEAVNRRATELIHDEIKARESTGKNLTHAAIEKTGTFARRVCGNTSEVPVFCRQDKALDEFGDEVIVSLEGLLDFAICCVGRRLSSRHIRTRAVHCIIVSFWRRAAQRLDRKRRSQIPMHMYCCCWR